MEILVTTMKPNDEITIRTHFSDYSFRVMDPVECKGVLSGGRLGQAQEAVFVETISPTDNAGPSSDHLGPGDRAVFLVGSNKLKKLTTSTITEVVVSAPSEQQLDDC